MIRLEEFIRIPARFIPLVAERAPWEIPAAIAPYLKELLDGLDSNYLIDDTVAIHRSATVEPGAVLKGPLLISENCFIAAHAYLRGGVILAQGARIGPGCEVKSSFIGSDSRLAHFNFIGDSLIGTDVNLEAGALTANHYNERKEKRIFVRIAGKSMDTRCTKFGALIGDHCRIGANAVLSPGTILSPHTVVNRLELIEQNPR